MKPHMHAMLLERTAKSLRAVELPVPQAGPGTLLIAVEACGVCRTDLRLVDGELPDPLLQVIPGHEIVSRVAAIGTDVAGIRLGQRVGVPWLGWTCGCCAFCAEGRENLCDAARFTGYQINGGYATHTVADARYCFPPARRGRPGPHGALAVRRADRLPRAAHGRRRAARRHLRLRCGGPHRRPGAEVPGTRVPAFTRAGDTASQAFARELGATWAGGTDEATPVPLDAALIFAPSGPLVPLALRRVTKGGRVVCAGIHMSEIPAFPYEILWGERSIHSVANLTRRDGIEFLELAARASIRAEVHRFPLALANEALDKLRHGEFQDVAVLTM
jgi:propanol-preferring alcohol dehydrogenase